LRVRDRGAHDDRLGAGPTGGSGLIGRVDAAFGDEHRGQTGIADGADEFEIGAGDRCALAGVAGQGGADDVGTGLGRGPGIAEAAAIGHDQGVRLFVEASDGLGQAQPVGPFAAGPVECDDVGPGQSHRKGVLERRGDDDPVGAVLPQPDDGYLDGRTGGLLT
jgi:hypothetical protein